MQHCPDKIIPAKKNIVAAQRSRSLRRAAFARARIRLLAQSRKRRLWLKRVDAYPLPAGFDPELLYVECGRCGSPVIWDEGRATALLRGAGIDPMELDASCIMITDACPACGAGPEYSVRIYRISAAGISHLAPLHGHA